MAQKRLTRNNSSSNQSFVSSTTKKTSIFPLANATKPRYIAPKKIELSELPDDILLTIFRYLPPIDLLNIGLVCRRWYHVSQDESLWHSLAIAYDLHQQASPLNSKQRVQTFLNNQIKTRLKNLFPKKFDPLTSYTGISDYQKIWLKSSDQFQFHLAFCDDRHQIIWTQKSDTIKYFDTSMSIRWFDLGKPEFLTNVQYLRLFATVTIDINTKPNRTRLPRGNEQLADVTQKPLRYVQKIESLLREYKFHWNTVRNSSISLTNDAKSPIRISQLPDDDDYLLATYDKDRSYAFLVFNINYLAFHESFFIGLRTTSSNLKVLSQMILPKQMPTIRDLEVSVFVCLRNMTTVFLRHRFPHCRLKHGHVPMIELIRCTDMAEELGPELEQLPKFNWKTEIFNGTISDLFLIDLVVINERQLVAFTATVPAKLTTTGGDQNGQGGEYLLSSNVWNIQSESQSNKRIRLEGTIMRLDDEYCALGKQSQSWHLQKMICQF